MIRQQPLVKVPLSPEYRMPASSSEPTGGRWAKGPPVASRGVGEASSRT